MNIPNIRLSVSALVYKVIWTPEVSDELLVNSENDYKNAIAVMKDNVIFGHLPHTAL